MIEPSLSADTLSMLHDEHSQRIALLERYVGDIHKATQHPDEHSKRLKALEIKQLTDRGESERHDIEITALQRRVIALEQKTNGLIQTRADHGHQFIVIIDRVKALEERVAALEQQQDTLHKWVVDTYAEHELEPLPKEELE